MATRTWNSTSSNTWTTAGNWAENSVPVDSDTVNINAGVAIDGVDQNAINPALINIGAEYEYGIGSSGSFLIISGDKLVISCAKKNQYGATQNIYIDSGGTDEIDDIQIDSRVEGQEIHIDGTIGDITINHGVLYLESGVDVDNVYVAWDGTGRRPQIFATAATVGVIQRMADCYVKASSGCAITTDTSAHGHLVTEGATAVTTHNLYGLARVTDNSSGTTTNLNVAPGAVWDAQLNVAGKTVTNSKTWGTGKILYNQSAGNITFTNDTLAMVQPSPKFPATPSGIPFS
jgi:hypothetical protein